MAIYSNHRQEFVYILASLLACLRYLNNERHRPHASHYIQALHHWLGKKKRTGRCQLAIDAFAGNKPCCYIF
jgi:hypothetical protein